MHSSGFDDAATESLTIEDVAGERLWDLLTPGGDHPDLLRRMDRWQAE